MATTEVPALPVTELRARCEALAAHALRLAAQLPDGLDDASRGRVDHALTEVEYHLGVAVRAAGLVTP